LPLMFQYILPCTTLTLSVERLSRLRSQSHN